MALGLRDWRDLTRLARTLREAMAPRTDEPPTVVAVTHCNHTKFLLRMAAFQHGCRVVIALSFRDAVRELAKRRVAALFYDDESFEADWRAHCAIAAEEHSMFFVLSRRPNDDLFLSVLGAGGCDVLRKPLVDGQLGNAIRFVLQTMCGVAGVRGGLEQAGVS